MARVPEAVAEFLSGKRLAVAGVSRDAAQPANAVYRKLRAAGHRCMRWWLRWQGRVPG